MRHLFAVFTLAALACAGTPDRAHEHPTHAHQGPLGHRFDDADKWARVFDDPGRDEWQMPDRVIEYLALEPGMTVADIGAGTGYFEGRLARAVGPEGRVLALDVEPDMIRHLEERARREGWDNVQPVLVPFDDPRLAAASVDRILIVDTWHHIPDRGEYVKKLASALAPRGFMLIVDFTMDSPLGPPKHHRLTPIQIAGELNQGGMYGTELSPGLRHQYVMKGEPPRPPPEHDVPPHPCGWTPPR
jgi:cyclopropane fatty-acyl-phospholipid synthase-like methyltransferase